MISIKTKALMSGLAINRKLRGAGSKRHSAARKQLASQYKKDRKDLKTFKHTRKHAKVLAHIANERSAGRTLPMNVD